MKDWWKETFKEEYLKSLGKMYSNENAKIEVDFILSNIPLKKKSKILDIPCGTGRHSVLLGNKDFDVIGIDYSKESLDIANKNRGANINFIRKDMRDLDLDERYNLIITLGNSFGYFSDEDNEKFIKNVSRLLKKKGYFILDLANFEGMAKNMKSGKKKRELIFDSIRVLEEMNFDKKNKISDLKWILTDKEGDTKELYGRLRFYTLKEIRGILDKYGLKILKIFGDFDNFPYSVDSSRLIIISQK